MGCWNETCMVTGLPIRESDSIRWFVVAQCDEEQWKGEAFPVSIAFKGNYDNYGGISECQKADKRFKLLYEFFRHILIENEETGRSKRVHSEMDVDEFLNQITRNRIDSSIYVKREEWPAMPGDSSNVEAITAYTKQLQRCGHTHFMIGSRYRLDLVMMHEAVYQRMLDETKCMPVLDRSDDREHRYTSLDYQDSYLEIYDKKDREELVVFSYAMRMMRREWRMADFSGAQDAYYDVNVAVARLIPDLAPRLAK